MRRSVLMLRARPRPAGLLADARSGHLSLAGLLSLLVAFLMLGEIPAGAATVGVHGSPCSIRHQGTVRCWGAAGRTLQIAAALPTAATGGPAVPLTGAVALSPSGQGTCAALIDGTVRCWAAATESLTAPGFAATPAEPAAGISGAANIRGDATQTCAVLRDGSLSCWTEGTFGGGHHSDTFYPGTPPTPVAGIADAVDVVRGPAFTCVLHRGGAVSCRGVGTDGQLGTGDGASSDRWVGVPGIGDATAIEAGSRHVCVIAGGGGVWCWGDGTRGQVGDGRLGVARSPQPVAGLTDAVAIAAGEGFTCAARREGTVACWGDGTRGQLGDGTRGAARPDGLRRIASRPVTVRGLAEPARDVSAGNGYACATLADAAVSCWGSGPLGSAVFPSTPATAAGIRDAVGLDLSFDTTCAVRASGTASCWGSGGGRFGHHATDRPRSTPVAVAGLRDVRQISTATDHACALRAGGLVACWGEGEDGQLGDGRAREAERPVEVVGLRNATGVATGLRYGCAVLADGSAWCWGTGAPGAVGARSSADNDWAPIARPVRVHGLPAVRQVVAGDDRACAVARSGTVSCWGDVSADAQRPRMVLRPEPVPGITDAVEISLGRSFGCALRRGGRVSCWGDGTAYGELGAGRLMRSRRAVEVRGVRGATSVSAYDGRVCAARGAKQVVCWGSTFTATPQRLAVAVPGTAGARTVRTGPGSSCALIARGVRCWGDGSQGQFGDGSLPSGHEGVQTEAHPVRGL